MIPNNMCWICEKSVSTVDEDEYSLVQHKGMVWVYHPKCLDRFFRTCNVMIALDIDDPE